MILIATDIITEHLRCGISQKSRLLQLVEAHPYQDFGLSVVSIQHLYQSKITFKAEQEKNLLTTLRVCKILPYTYEIAQTAGQLQRDLKQPVKFTTAAIAATALVHNIPLFTQLAAEFSAYPQLHLFT
jgi:predicted nucleic acid-binding protein